MLKKIIFLFILLLVIFSCSENKSKNLDQQYPLLIEAEQLTAKAYSLSGNEKKEYFSRSAVKLEEAVKKYNLNNGYIFYNIGNNWFSAGNLGKAIFYYRKAEKRLPSNNNIKNNLAFARSTVVDEINYSGSDRLLRTLFFIHYDISFKYKVIVMILFIFLSFGSASYLIFKKKRFVKNLLIVFSIFSILMISSIIVDLSKKQEGVITINEIIARNGDSNGYESSFASPLHEGVEFILISSRSGWFQIELIDGRRCWIPDLAADLID